ncbi:MAG: hypothetical protein MUC50_24285 [Myxococcota bacterium]|nr:hypothetical protein [Myxococcota bacterium]
MKEERDSRARAKNSAPAPLDLTRVEFHRGALAYLSAPAEARPAVAYLTPTEKSTQLERSCTRCGGKTTCVHIKSAVQAHKAVSAAHAPGDINAAFRSSRWFQGLSILANICPVDVRGTTAAIVQTPSGSAVQIHGQGGVLLATYQGQSAQNMHLFERMQHQPGQREMPTRGEVLVALIARTRTPLEWQMVNAGARTRRQVAEESLWFRLAYHGFCAHGSLPLRFSPAIDLVTGNFTVEAKFADLDVPILRAVVSRLHVRSVLAEFARIFPDEKALRIHPVPVQSLFKVDANTELDLVAIEPVLRLMQQDGEERFFSRQDLERFRYGEDLVYIPELGLLAEFEPQRGTPRKFRAPVRMTLARSQIPALLEELRPKGTDPKDAPQILGLGLVERFDTIEVSAQAVDQDWYWLSINYGAGAARINLRDLLAARKRGERFLATEHGWVDCYAMAFEPLAPLVERHTQEELSDKNKALRVSRRELLRLEATAAEKVKVTSSTPVNLALARMLELQAARSLEPLVGLTSVLRDYQRRGAEWLLFLYDNGQGGLLCV